jgi:uncharacterized protein (DUF1330 family)
MTTTAPGYGQVDRDYAMRMATCPPEEDGPVWMVNLMHYRGEAVYAGGKSGISGREADERYAPLDILSDLGAEVAFMGEVEQQILGDAPRWDRVAVVRYPTRRSFIEMQARPDFQERHVHKEAGMAQTIVAGCLPLGPPRDLSSAQATDSTDATEPAWAEVPHPPTDEDGPIVVFHLLRFHEDASETGIAAYQKAAKPVVVAQGRRVLGWFGVEGTIVGDGRAWDQAHFNAFPSLRAFNAVLDDPDRQAAQAAHRDVAVADTYTMVLRPTIDRLAASLAAPS